MKAAPLVLTNLTKHYGKNRGVENISLALKPGEVFGFLGPNGAGKTTTIRTILDFIRPTGGSISILDHDSASVEVKEHIGYLAGDIALYETMTGRQLLKYLTHLGRRTDWAYVDRLSSQLQAELDRPIRTLSKGNKQKIGLIQAFMHNPELIILDEPTSGLDPLMQQAFYDIAAEAKASGKTLFVSSHNLGEIQRICDRAAFIRDGKLIAIEDVAKAKNLSLRRFHVWFAKTAPEAVLRKITGVTALSVQDTYAQVTIKGPIDQFIKALAKYEVVNLEQEETSLEELFMHYYRGGGHA